MNHIFVQDKIKIRQNLFPLSHYFVRPSAFCSQVLLRHFTWASPVGNLVVFTSSEKRNTGRIYYSPRGDYHVGGVVANLISRQTFRRFGKFHDLEKTLVHNFPQHHPRPPRSAIAIFKGSFTLKRKRHDFHVGLQNPISCSH